YERLWWKAIRDRDFRAVEWHLAPIYTLTTPTGIRDRQQALEYFQSLNVNDIEIAELQVKPEGGDMVVSYVASLRTASIPNPQRFYMTTVWQQGKKGWFAIAHSETPAAAS
ncbi:MAG: nuclear transport factor 2 family protein, partial [Acidobacteria bacterium]|nr:nuclear transport factor 2 family protein [Acidobacteriota bacterium]